VRAGASQGHVSLRAFNVKGRVFSKQPIGQAWFWLLSVVIGVVAAFGAVLFRLLIGFFHNLLFLGHLSAGYDANLHTPASPWGAGVILVPVLGAIGVAFLVKNYALEAKGHGVPEVMDAIYYRKGVIRPVVAVIKSLASALSIGSGGSVGREGPIVQIGSSFGSTLGQLLQLPSSQRITMIAAGAGGGIAATFNTPIGGVLFAAELLLHEVSVWTLVPVVISTATATYVGRLLLGANPSFRIPTLETPYFHRTQPVLLLGYVGLGCLLGVVSALFIKAINGFEDFFEEKVPGGYYVRHLLGMLVVGLLLCLAQVSWAHYYIEGVGYATIQDVLTGTLTSVWLLACLFALKLLVTCLTLGSGGSGGVFSPSLFVGATFGAAYGSLLRWAFPALPVSAPAFAVVGMAGLVGGVTGAAITSIVIIFEMTLDYNVILPMTITVAMSYGIRHLLSRESIYTSKLARRGHYMPEALQATFYYVKLARELMQEHLPVAPASASVEAVVKLMAEPGRAGICLVEREGQLLGVLRKQTALEVLVEGDNAVRVGDIAEKDFETIPETMTLFELISEMRLKRTALFVVAPERGPLPISKVKGVISKERIAESMADAADLFAR
jgi:CIC family chloride channel protein